MKTILFLVLTTSAIVSSQKAIAVLRHNAVTGHICFEETPEGNVAVNINVTGLLPKGDHGFHIHQFGDLTDGCMSTGSHFNPGHHTHGSPTDQVRHVGDLGNIVSDESGNSIKRIVDSQIKMSGPNSIIGRAVVIHHGQDDLGRGTGDKEAESKKTGNAGGRVACAIIGYQNI